MIGKLILSSVWIGIICLFVDIVKTEKEIKELEKENERLDELLKRM